MNPWWSNSNPRWSNEPKRSAVVCCILENHLSLQKLFEASVYPDGGRNGRNLVHSFGSSFHSHDGSMGLEYLQIFG